MVREKYYLGQKVFRISNGRIAEEFVVAIGIVAGKYKYHTNDKKTIESSLYLHYKEEDIFSSKEELIKYLEMN